MKYNILSKLGNVIILFFVIIVVTITIKGSSDIKYYQNNIDTRMFGPFETSNNSSRFALTEAIVKNKSLFLSDELASVASPDLTKINGKFITIFTPGISFMGLPFYYLGYKFGYPQISTYLLSSFISIINIYLIANILLKLKMNKWISIFCGLIYLFATNSLSYSNSFNQHQVSTFLLLLSILLSIKPITYLNNLIFGIIYGIAILVDIPNALLLLPILTYQACRNVRVIPEKKIYSLKINTSILLIVMGLLPSMFLFGWYNRSVTGDYLKLGQVYGRYIYTNTRIEDVVEISKKKDKSEFKQFDSRRLLSGLTVLLFSRDRGIVVYSPIFIFGIVGMIIASKRKNNYLNIILLSTVIMNLIVYSLFNDPWGGWAFGPRYLIPSNAILSLLIAFTINKYYKNLLFISILGIVLIYSVSINVLGALTTQLVPSSVQLPFLTGKVSDTFLYNYSFLKSNMSSSLFYNLLLADHINFANFVAIVVIAMIIFFGVIYLLILKDKNKSHE